MGCWRALWGASGSRSMRTRIILALLRKAWRSASPKSSNGCRCPLLHSKAVNPVDCTQDTVCNTWTTRRGPLCQPFCPRLFPDSWMRSIASSWACQPHWSRINPPPGATRSPGVTSGERGAKIFQDQGCLPEICEHT